MTPIVHPALPGPGLLLCGRRPGAELAPLLDLGVTGVACLLEDGEFPIALREGYARANLCVLRFPIADRGVPEDPVVFATFVADLRARLLAGERIYLHCLAGLGRTGTVLACLLGAAGATGDLVSLVREVYSSSAVETPEQQAFVRRFVSLP